MTIRKCFGMRTEASLKRQYGRVMAARLDGHPHPVLIAGRDMDEDDGWVTVEEEQVKPFWKSDLDFRMGRGWSRKTVTQSQHTIRLVEREADTPCEYYEVVRP